MAVRGVVRVSELGKETCEEITRETECRKTKGESK